MPRCEQNGALYEAILALKVKADLEKELELDLRTVLAHLRVQELALVEPGSSHVKNWNAVLDIVLLTDVPLSAAFVNCKVSCKLLSDTVSVNYLRL